MSEAPQGLLNGSPLGQSLAASRGLHYGDGVFRTFLKFDGQLIDFKLQTLKLEHDARALGLEPPPAVLLRQEADGLSAGQAAAVLKILLLRAGAGRGYAPRGTAADRLLLRYPLPLYPAACWREGIRAFRCGLRLGRQPALAGIKHLNRLEQVLASRDWPEGMDEGILCDERGAPVCGSRSNLFWVGEGVLHTPALDGCGVAGMMRDKVLAAAAALGMAVRIETRPWAKLIDADEAFVSNSLIGLWPLRELEQRRWPAPGPVTARLAAALRHPYIASSTP
ncbi:MAG TPA: aminodeoxychorismate lyase [Nevskia sp.]|nr:aminodeoxychorismate lyase [Nevskia sp.]